MSKKLALAIVLMACSVGVSAQSDRRLFNDKWLFHYGEIKGAELPTYSDDDWRELDLPHDWSIENLPEQIADSIIGPFDKSAVGGTCVGFTKGGTGWYRKTFRLTSDEKGKQVSVHFDGVYMNAEVWLNGHRLGLYHHGYVPFWYDLTPYLNATGDNVLAVKVVNEGVNSRWYSGSGIYRNVYLCVKEKQAVTTWGIKVTTPVVLDSQAKVMVETNIGNKDASIKRLTLVTTILSPDSQEVDRQKSTINIGGNEERVVMQDFSVDKPDLWSPDAPSLYYVVTEVWDKQELKDKVCTTFGIRSISFDAEHGFLLNGQQTILRGGCIHHDNGLLGAAAFEQAEERKIRLLKANGYNAIRTSHNPASELLLNICDRLGMLVITEAFDVWTVEKSGNPQDYHLYFKECWEQDVENFVMRDRNHPCIIMWSIGNEIPERVKPEGVEITKMLADKFRNLDPTRPVTEAFCTYQEDMNKGLSWDETIEPMSYLDVIGYNYVGELHFRKDHKNHPQRVMYASEIGPLRSLQYYTHAEEKPYVIGDFIWTAIDYIGEVAIGRRTYAKQNGPVQDFGWPWYNAFCGDIDLIGCRKPQSYYRNVVWRQMPLAMAVHAPIPDGMVENLSGWGWPDERQSWTWNGCEGRLMDVRVLSRAPIVRLYLNGEMIGEQQMPNGRIDARFKVNYRPGELKAVNVVDGKETDCYILQTVGETAQILMTPEQEKAKADRGQIVYVMVNLADSQGKTDPNINNATIDFSVEGEAEILGVGNADPQAPMRFQGRTCRTYEGRCLVVLRSSGKPGIATLSALAKGVEGKKARILFE